MNFRLFGQRLLVRKISARQGTLFVPENEDEINKMARVVAIANGKRPGLSDVDIFLKVGDLIFFQTNAYQQAGFMYPVNSKIIYINLLQSEVIAKIDAEPNDEAPEMTLERFHVVGDWCLVRPYMKKQSSLIFVPETVEDTLKINFKLADKGHTVDLDIAQGDELVLCHGRTNPLRIGHEDVGYVHKNDVYGVVEEEKADGSVQVEPQQA